MTRAPYVLGEPGSFDLESMICYRGMEVDDDAEIPEQT